MRSLLIICALLLSCVSIDAQSFWFGPRGGLSVGTQQGGGLGVQPMLGYHAGFFLETYDEGNEIGSLYANIGLHQRGRSTRRFFSRIQNVTIAGINYRYNNVCLELGAKKFYRDRMYYKMGVRAEYSAFNNLEEISTRVISIYSPFPQFVRPFTGGITIGGGYQYELAELYGIAIEFNIMPDLFNQYTSPAIDNLIDPFSGQPRSIGAQQVRNTTLEITFAMRFLRKVIYID